jgi:CubicO group peptidase (beta-lactamase class C family)
MPPPRAAHDAGSMTTTAPDIDGFTAPAWEAVQDAFADTFARHGEAGAAVCVYQGGRPVVDLAAGVTAVGRPYTRETIQPFMSVSKGIVAIAANMLADQGMLDLDAPVARYWPEFAQAGKETIPVRWLLTHEAGLAVLDRRLSRAELLSWTPVITALEAQSPNWPPGTAHGYHSMTYGFLVGEVIRRVTGQFPGPWIASHLSAPLHAPCHLGLPQALRGSVAPVLPFPPRPEGSASTLRLDPDSLPYRAAFGCTDPPLSPLAVNDPDVQAAQLPAANGIGSARGLAGKGKKPGSRGTSVSRSHREPDHGPMSVVRRTDASWPEARLRPNGRRRSSSANCSSRPWPAASPRRTPPWLSLRTGTSRSPIGICPRGRRTKARCPRASLRIGRYSHEM